MTGERTVPAGLTRRELLAAGLGVGGGLLLAGCSSDSAGPGTTGDGATLRYAAVGSPSTATYDPHGGLGNESDLVRFALTYDPLTVPGPDGQTLPRLATSWEPDRSLTRWRIELRDDATFHDGRPVRAADVLYSLRRIDDKAAENFGRMAVFDLEASRVTREHTLELVTVRPYAVVGRALEGATFVVPAGSDDFTKPVPGSGPFRQVGGDVASAVLERDTDWWGPPPPTRRIEVRAVPDPQARADAVLSGQADLAGGVSPAAARAAEQRGDVQLIRRPAGVMYPFVMRLDSEPFDDPRVRTAMQLAADRQELLDTVFLGFGQVGNDLITPRDPSSPDELPQRTRDVARARRLLAEAGYPGGVDVTLHTTTSYPGMDTAATLFAEQLADIGMRARVEVAPPDTYFTEVFAQQPFYVGFFGGIPFLDVARVSLAADSPTNETAWQRPEWQAGLDAAVATADPQQRSERLGELQRVLRDEGGYVVWALGDELKLAAPGMRNVPTGPGFSAVFLDQVRMQR